MAAVAEATYPVGQAAEGEIPDGATPIGPLAQDEGEEAKPVLRPDKEVLEKILELVQRMDALDAQAREINAARSLVREEVENLGVNRHAFAFVRRFWNFDERQRDGFDLSLVICRHAVGLPLESQLQADLFEGTSSEAPSDNGGE